MGQGRRARLIAGPRGRVARPFSTRSATAGSAAGVALLAHPHRHRLHLRLRLHRAQQVAGRRGGRGRAQQDSKADHQVRIHCYSGVAYLVNSHSIKLSDTRS
ncbi:hypothetical protein Bcep18194_A4596 [Burkholderia lata]|uniref:Uncharacterized protein n=1 Tax=Burkholderia lata (strain ATCC 17760 / DSM 23089 / LMG 22485 / NCIMB 9086 / R18194 / 383) TaxID=482957 RepID=Q39H74_BURL3|nr:hypothetical protein Bcep18194_A4596 [Burkholderia lata]